MTGHSPTAELWRVTMARTDGRLAGSGIWLRPSAPALGEHPSPTWTIEAPGLASGHPRQRHAQIRRPGGFT